MPLRIPFLLIAFLLASCMDGAATPGKEPVVGGPCEGCEAVFDGLPDSLSWTTRIAPAGEPGEPLRIDGVVRDGAGRPVAGVIVYAYHTDQNGIYPRDDRYGGYAARHGRLRGWARTDTGGRYRFATIRPAGYPDTPFPQHVHMHIVEPGRCTYWIDDLHFDDDARLARASREHQEDRGGSGVTHPVRGSDGTWRVTRDIVLGKNIPGYPE